MQRLTNTINPKEGPPGAGVAVSESGSMTKALMLEWFKFFVKSIPPSRPFLIIWDGHDTHVFVELLELVVAHGGIAMQVPSHSTHITQACDLLFGTAVSIYVQCIITENACLQYTTNTTERRV
jgi:hypothetical protein